MFPVGQWYRLLLTTASAFFISIHWYSYDSSHQSSVLNDFLMERQCIRWLPMRWSGIHSFFFFFNRNRFSFHPYIYWGGFHINSVWPCPPTMEVSLTKLFCSYQTMLFCLEFLGLEMNSSPKLGNYFSPTRLLERCYLASMYLVGHKVRCSIWVL